MVQYSKPQALFTTRGHETEQSEMCDDDGQARTGPLLVISDWWKPALFPGFAR